MLFLVDANALIDAHRDYYPIGRVPEFWEWLVYQEEHRRIRIPVEVSKEALAGRQDKLTDRVKQNTPALILDETAEPRNVEFALNRGYAPDLSDEEIEQVGQDPFLVAYALASRRHRTIVTTEVSKPKKKRANRHMPDVCHELGLGCCNTFELIRRLDFRTGWKP